jgi:hypothetical protein
LPAWLAYLKSVTVLEPSGNSAAEVVSAIARLGSRPQGKRLVARLALVGVAVAALLAGGAIAGGTPAKTDRTGGPELPNPVQLRFNYKPVAQAGLALDDTLRVNLQTQRRIVDGERLAQQPGGFYSYNTAYPGADERILGTLIREIRASSLAAAVVAGRFFFPEHAEPRRRAFACSGPRHWSLPPTSTCTWTATRATPASCTSRAPSGCSRARWRS